MPLTRMMTVEGAEVSALERLVARWHEGQAGLAPGHLRSRVSAAGDGRYLIEVDFTSVEAARPSNQRSEIAEWPRRLAPGDRGYQNLQEIFSTCTD